MKIKKIHIKDFHQFKDFTLDITYPKGHTKEGQPLDKVCFIGQSGSGKTTLLELIPKFLYDYDTNLITKSGINSVSDEITMEVVFGLLNEYSIDIEIKNDELYSWVWANPKINNQKCDRKEVLNYYDEKWENNLSSKLIYFPANLNYNLDIEVDKNIHDKEIIDFSKDKVSSVWNLILEKIQKYQEQEIAIRQNISKTVEQSSNDLNIIQKALKELENWKKNEFNPIVDVADNCLNKLLENFKIRIKTEIDFKTKNDIGFIKIEDYNQNEIPHDLWSTGTKQVILSALPLYLLEPKNTIILFDEPERSLYPDLQRIITDYYYSLTKNCQFFYSTHSPIIASNFEPWEIVELKFNKDGKIFREEYYEGENHINNYKLNPKLMRWDDILQRVFDLQDDGSMERRLKLNELATLNIKIQKIQKKNNTKEKSEEEIDILKKIEILSNELSKWN
ncbi:AAA family ATPase [Flavobacterium sp. MC2016-06]|uniref:ATP-binding protein n=1 Tax=Flavobacterium sp. MC2016-06 TaxID=2676308 RepID=UPI0012BA7B08|nr:ATP-binding protein [Flavobacterium sp. MC2016-06]MBU3859878.1 AAA family ATPase [Flavobacterium sp. MC2016-06]